MTPQSTTVAAIIAVAAFTLSGWFALPLLADSQQKLEVQASLYLERARRLLSLYSPTVTYGALVSDQLHAAQPDFTEERLSETDGETYQEIHQAFWQGFEPRDWQQSPPRAVKPSYANIGGQMREGLRARAAIQSENKQLLKDALGEIEAALALEIGESSGRNHAEAMRLKGVILFHQAAAEHHRAFLERAELEPTRQALSTLAAITSRLAASRNLLADSGIEDRIREVRQKMTQAQDVLNQDERELAKVSARIADLEKRLADANRRIEKARDAMEKLRESGLNFSLPNPVDDFEQRYSEQDQISRTAQREAQLIESGGLPKAQIDASGDFLTGKYLENGSAMALTPEFGLAHFRTEYAALAAVVQRGRQAIEDFNSDIARLEGIREALRTAQQNAERELAKAATDTSEVYTELTRRQADLAKTEDAALRLYDQSAAAFQQAASLAEQRIADAREHTAELSPEARQFSAWNERENDGWIAAFMSAQTADARLAKTRILLDRYQSHRQAAAALETISNTLDLKDVDPQAEAEKAAAAKTAAFDEITKAVAALEKSHKSADKNWTFVAQTAAANDLLALFDEKDYVTDAMETYRSAVKGRESDASVLAIAARLKTLESRQ